MKKYPTVLFSLLFVSVNLFSQTDSKPTNPKKSKTERVDSTGLTIKARKIKDSTPSVQEESLAGQEQREVIYTIVEEAAEFPGGVHEMMKFIKINIHYPDSAKKYGISGKCFLKFIVTDTGNIKDIEVLKGVPGCSECDLEAIRVVKMMPKWTPAYMNNRAVNIYYNLPFNFKAN